MRKEFEAALKSAEKQIPFALFAYPGYEDFQFFANPGGSTQTGKPYFIVSKWNTPFSDSIRIYKEMEADELLSKIESLPSQPSVSPLQTSSTDKKSYVETLNKLISILKYRGGKTVISRIIANPDISLDLSHLLHLQFDAFPETFRFFYYTPQTGLWMGTSPELLFEYNSESGEFQTMSLAGTQICDSVEWDNKNIQEQNLVKEFIISILNEYNAQYSVKRSEDVNFKPVRHICDIFEGILPKESFPIIIDRLSPTPALSGFPVATALKEISELENHDRECYGGYVGAVDSKQLKLFVNLRSLKLIQTGYCIFAGGGITPYSIPEDEWNETENKTMILRKNISESLR